MCISGGVRDVPTVGALSRMKRCPIQRDGSSGIDPPRTTASTESTDHEEQRRPSCAERGATSRWRSRPVRARHPFRGRPWALRVSRRPRSGPPRGRDRCLVSRWVSSLIMRRSGRRPAFARMMAGCTARARTRGDRTRRNSCRSFDYAAGVTYRMGPSDDEYFSVEECRNDVEVAFTQALNARAEPWLARGVTLNAIRQEHGRDNFTLPRSAIVPRAQFPRRGRRANSRPTLRHRRGRRI